LEVSLRAICWSRSGTCLLVVDGGDDRSSGAVEVGVTATQGHCHQGHVN